MNTLFKIVGVGVLATMLSACGEMVEIPSAHVGKVMNKEGYSEKTYMPSRFRLDVCWLGQVCDKLVVADVSDRTVDESFSLVMPRDRLNMDFTVGISYTVDSDSVSTLFQSLPVREAENGMRTISISSAYQTYARPIIMSETRNFLSKYSIDEVTTNRAEVSYGLRDHLREKVESQTPFVIKNVGLNDASPPPIIVESQMNTARHREKIRQEEQEQEVAQLRLQRKLDNENMRRRIEIEKAEASAEVNKIVAESMTAKYERYRMLEIMDNYSQSDNKMLIPVGMIDQMATQFMVGNAASK